MASKIKLSPGQEVVLRWVCSGCDIALCPRGSIHPATWATLRGYGFVAPPVGGVYEATDAGRAWVAAKDGGAT